MNNKLIKTTDLVKKILEEQPETRNSDALLYVRACNDINPGTVDMPFSFVLLNQKTLGLPSMETVGRCRRKIVENNPHLAGCDTVQAGRSENEEAFREYARG